MKLLKEYHRENPHADYESWWNSYSNDLSSWLRSYYKKNFMQIIENAQNQEDYPDPEDYPTWSDEFGDGSAYSEDVNKYWADVEKILDVAIDRIVKDCDIPLTDIFYPDPYGD